MYWYFIIMYSSHHVVDPSTHTVSSSLCIIYYLFITTWSHVQFVHLHSKWTSRRNKLQRCTAKKWQISPTSWEKSSWTSWRRSSMATAFSGSCLRDLERRCALLRCQEFWTTWDFQIPSNFPVSVPWKSRSGRSAPLFWFPSMAKVYHFTKRDCFAGFS